MSHVRRRAIASLAGLLLMLPLAGCRHDHAGSGVAHLPPVKPGEQLPRRGDEIMVCGQLFHTGAPVVLWLDQGGYDFYRLGKQVPMRMEPLTDEEVARIKRDGWSLDLLRQKVDQFVLHYDVAGLSRTCFKVLGDRGLGVHFMCDIDGTIYQTMDLKDCAYHATKANGRSVGVEIANMGAYANIVPLMEWYAKDEDGRTRITIPHRFGTGGVRTPDFIGRPARNDLVRGPVHGEMLRQYDFTPQQYDSLAKLTATLCTVFPKIQCDYPRLKTSLGQPTTRMTTRPAGDPTTRPGALAAPGEPGVLIAHTLTDEQYDNYQGVLGHYHVQTDKIDPGPAMQWDRIISQARSLMTREALEANRRMRGHPARFIPSPESAESGESAPPPRRTRATTRPAAATTATTRAATRPD